MRIDSTNIILDPNPVLREKAKDVPLPLSEEDRQILTDMLEYVRNSHDEEFCKEYNVRASVGIAAPQIGLSKKMLAISIADEENNVEFALVNPKIISNSTKIQTLNLLSGGPNAVVLFETDEDVLSWPEVYQRGKTSGEMFRRIHKSVVIDGVECLKKPAQTDPDVNTKRLQADIDAGYITITAVNGNNHESVDRKVSRYENGRYYLTDTNNSSADFVVCTDPTPRKYDKEGMQ